MSKKPNRKKRGHTGKNPVQRLKLGTIFALAAAAELFLLIFYDSYQNGTVETVVGIYEAMRVLVYAMPCALVLCAVLWLVLSKAGKGGAARVFAWLSCVFAFLSVWALLTELYTFKGIKFLAIIVALAAVLTLIYFVYQREFFCSSLIVAGGTGALVVFRRSAAWGFLSPRVYAVYAVAALLLVLCLLLTLHLRRTRGILSLNGKEWRLFRSSADYRAVFLSCAIVAFALAASLLLGNPAAYFSIFGLGAYFFLMAVYHTTRLM